MRRFTIKEEKVATISQVIKYRALARDPHEGGGVRFSFILRISIIKDFQVCYMHIN